MVGVGPYVAESHMLIDFDNSAWGYRGFDFNYFFVQVSYALLGTDPCYGMNYILASKLSKRRGIDDVP